MNKKQQLHVAWIKRLRLYTEGYKLRAEGYKLRAEGDILWADSITSLHGNIQIKWENANCTLGKFGMFYADVDPYDLPEDTLIRLHEKENTK